MLLKDEDIDKILQRLKEMRSSDSLPSDNEDRNNFRTCISCSIGEVILYCDGDVITHDGEIIATFA